VSKTANLNVLKTRKPVSYCTYVIDNSLSMWLVYLPLVLLQTNRNLSPPFRYSSASVWFYWILKQLVISKQGFCHIP